MRILLYGSTVLSAHIESSLSGVVGHVPSLEPAFPGIMQSPVVSEATPHDMKLSIQYDRKITSSDNAYNLHTGLLPLYGGRDILHHTLENRDSEQGLTFHKITDQFDEGAIISKITYPVLPSDTIVDLYRRMIAIAPAFVQASLLLLPLIPVHSLRGQKPVLYKHEDLVNSERYAQDGKRLRDFLLQTGNLRR